MITFGEDVTKQLSSNKLEDLRKQAAEIKADRTPKVDRHAQRLADQAKATEAQIRNLYGLADAYQISGTAALIAEARSEEHTSELQSLMRISYAVFCLKKKNTQNKTQKQ